MLSAARCIGSAGLVISLGVLALASSMKVSAQSATLEVTTDTPEYCLRLLDRLSALVQASPAGPPPEVTALSTEGQRMCDAGQARGGILRLRRAWLLMTHSAGAPPQPFTPPPVTSPPVTLPPATVPPVPVPPVPVPPVPVPPVTVPPAAAGAAPPAPEPIAPMATPQRALALSPQ